MDKLRTCRIENIDAPIGTPIRFNGKTIGRVIRNKDKGYCEIAINNEEAYSLLRGYNYSFGVEVIRND
jgi:hypothetical protein